MTIKDRSGQVIFSKEGKLPADGLDELILDNADLRGTDLTGLMVTGGLFRNADLSRADLYWDVLISCDFRGANFSDADLRGINAVSTDFSYALFNGANLGRNALGQPSVFKHCNFSGAILDGANLDGAIFDDSTTFPVGFDPSQRGMIRRPL